MKPNNIPDGNYPAYQEGWVVSFYYQMRLVTFKANEYRKDVTFVGVIIKDGKFEIEYS